MIKTQLEKDLNECLENVIALTVGQKERKEEAELAETFYKLKLEEDKLELERQRQKDASDLEKLKVEAEAAKAKEQRLLNWAGLGVQLGTTIFMAACYDMWLTRGYKFEEFGTVRSPHLRNLIGRILPRFK
jgi:hypothetical protein|nr:MAG TPA: hypothetical protein [Caudoviricetes sp.]